MLGAKHFPVPTQWAWKHLKVFCSSYLHKSHMCPMFSLCINRGFHILRQSHSSGAWGLGWGQKCPCPCVSSQYSINTQLLLRNLQTPSDNLNSDKRKHPKGFHKGFQSHSWAYWPVWNLLAIQSNRNILMFPLTAQSDETLKPAKEPTMIWLELPETKLKSSS